jgi:hypothetical protein
VNRDEITKLENYLRKLFQLQSIEVRQRPNKDDSAEVYIGDEFIGIMFRDDDDGDLSYQFQMAILDFDLRYLRTLFVCPIAALFEDPFCLSYRCAI